MNRHKRMAVWVSVLITALPITACGQVKEDQVVNTGEASVSPQESNEQTAESTGAEIKEDEAADATEAVIKEEEAADAVEAVIKEQENNAQEVEDTEPEMTAEELLDLFVDGAICAVDPEDLASTFYITDFNMDSGEWDSYSVGEKVDLDNDGENELVLCGPYGGIYLDARDGKVYVFAAGEGNALMLSYVVYNGATWIMYSNRMNTGYEAYHMEKFEGADHLVAEIDFGEELIDEKDAESGRKYTWNGAEISYDEYMALGSKIFATEVNTD